MLMPVAVGKRGGYSVTVAVTVGVMVSVEVGVGVCVGSLSACATNGVSIVGELVVSGVGESTT